MLAPDGMAVRACLGIVWAFYGLIQRGLAHELAACLDEPYMKL